MKPVYYSERILGVLIKRQDKRFTIKNLKEEGRLSGIPRQSLSNALAALIRKRLVNRFPISKVGNCHYEYSLNADLISSDNWKELLTTLESFPKASEDKKEDPEPLF